jgi:phenylacetate-CoA ligase
MNSRPAEISPELRTRFPLIDAEGARLLHDLLEHPHAPRWNHEGSDRLDADGLRQVRSFAQMLGEQRTARKDIPAWLEDWTARLRTHVPTFRTRLTEKRTDDWTSISTMSREDIAIRPETFVADDLDLDRMIVYRTAGTTGHALLVPNDPVSVACYQPMVEFALRRYGVTPQFRSGMVAGFLIGAQIRTVTCPSVLAAWNGAGFAKLNLNASEWPSPESPHRYFETFQPFFLSGDPISFSHLLKLAIHVQPAAMISTAVAMSASLKERLSSRYKCPVIDWYSLTETGPIGYACPEGNGYHVLPHDLYVETLGADGAPTPEGNRGEITVTGGRNPFLPLLRYRTGDWGRIDHGECPCGDPTPRIVELEGRQPVILRSATGAVVNTVDVSRVLREFPLVQHEFVQKADRSCELSVRPIDADHPPDTSQLQRALQQLLGADTPIVVRIDASLGNRGGTDKRLPYRSEFLLED